jgi:diaminopimelate decarboxylase
MDYDQVEIRDGRLVFNGCDVTALAQQYGTPLMLLSETVVRGKCAQIKRQFLERYADTRAAYAGKAFLTIGLCRILDEEGFGLDVVSGGELYTAIKAGFPAERIEFNGNNKTRAELEMAAGYGVGRIIVDQPDEIELIAEVYRTAGKRANILLRVNPAVTDTDTHAYIATGHRDSKFGIPLDEEVFWPVVEKALATEEVDLLGFHFHVGSQLFDPRSHLSALDTVLELVLAMRERYGVVIRELNVGGGIGVRYLKADRPPGFAEFLDPVMERIDAFAEQNSLRRPTVVIEPGRSVVAEAGMTLYTVGHVKRIPEGSVFVSVDGGMTDNIRPALYQAEYQAIIANKADLPTQEKVVLCGRCCESGDILIHELDIPEPSPGDIIAVFSTGAYCYAMASNYNKLLLPAVLLLKQGQAKVMVQRQSYDDLIRLEV